MKTLSKLKPSAMSPDVKAMIDRRHSMEQRGHFEPLGRLLYLKTPHGNMLWPVENGECMGPDVGQCVDDDGLILPDVLLLCGPWLGLPPVRTNSSTPCPKCRHVCHICNGTKKKICENVGCGGNGWIPGPWQPCPGPNCSAATAKINPEGCEVCRNSGHVPKQIQCPMCLGTKEMTCPHCKGSGKISTGKVGGSVDYKADDCAACKGTGWKGAWKAQNVEQFTNATLFEVKNPKRGAMLALGPIYEFGIEASRSRQTRIFDVTQDEMGDFLVLLVPGKATRNAKAYLVGGTVREREARNGAVA